MRPIGAPPVSSIIGNLFPGRESAAFSEDRTFTSTGSGRLASLPLSSCPGCSTIARCLSLQTVSMQLHAREGQTCHGGPSLPQVTSTSPSNSMTSTFSTRMTRAPSMRQPWLISSSDSPPASLM